MLSNAPWDSILKPNMRPCDGATSSVGFIRMVVGMLLHRNHVGMQDGF